MRSLPSALIAAALLSACSATDNHNTTQVNVVPPPVAAPRSAPPTVVRTAGGVVPCDGEGQLASVPGPQIPVRYRNDTAAPVLLYWLNLNGERQSYGEVEPGATRFRPGSATSFWLVSDAQDHCIGIVHPGGETPTIVVRPSATSSTKAELIAALEATETVPSGTERRINFMATVNETCKPEGEVIARIVSRPAHGNAGVRDASDYPNFPQNNPRHTCNAEAVPGTEIWYRSSDGYTGDDTLSVEYFLPGGRDRYINYLLTVK